MPKKTSRKSTSTKRKRKDVVRIAIIGTGYVGLVSGTGLAEVGHQVVCIDRNADKVKRMRRGQSPIHEPGLESLMKKNIKAGRLSFTLDLPKAVQESEVIMIAVGTPSRNDRRADLTHVANAARQIAEVAEGYKVVVNKSTVPVRTGEKVAETLRAYSKNGAEFDVVSNPEFLREGSAVVDFLKPDRVVIGVSTPQAENIMRRVYRPFRSKIVMTDVNSAEVIKYASNSFLATKISFANSLAQICERTGANVDDVVYGMGIDKRIGKEFLRPGIGWGGSCFPKDVSAFINTGREYGYDFSILKAAEEVNMEIRRHFIEVIEDALWTLNNKTIAIWGLAFKPNTDDMRSAPSLDVINYLREHGAAIRVYDPVAMKNAREILGEKNITYASSAYSAIKDSDALVVITDWDEFKKASLERIRKDLSRPLVIDGRNIFDPHEMKQRGFVYRSVGRPY